MQTSKKVMFSIILLIIFVGGISLTVVSPYLNSHMDYNQDGEILDNMAGSIDFVVIGASHAMCSYVPDVLDEELGVTSYNLSTTLMPLSARYVMLEKELSRNPVKTVILEMSYDNLQRNIAVDEGSGENIMFARLDTWSERLSYLFKYVKPDQWLDIYSRTMNSGLTAWKDILLNGGVVDNTVALNKGFYPREVVDISVDEEQFKEIYHTRSSMTGFRKENIKLFEDIISLCQNYGVNAIIAISPGADSYIYRYDDLDAYDSWMKTFAEDHGCNFFDFNLMINRSDIINDKTSFWDGPHMSEQGARNFTKEFSSIMKKIDSGEDTSKLFYSSFEELLLDSPYSKYTD